MIAPEEHSVAPVEARDRQVPLAVHDALAYRRQS